ncbi:MAG: hydrolase [Clostridia bacterium]|nr:hydrolase [Clostridia bacterium]NLS86221.1 hydrolase [Oscillospiraceae bacterium]
MIYFTSDLHFFFKKFSRVGTRVFDSFEEKNEFLVTQWNSVVSEKYEVYILGDVSNGGGAETAEIIRRLNGKKYLVRGNNDHYLDDPTFDETVFEWCKDYYELHTMGTKFILFHFPIEVWCGCKNNRIHIHGHLHRLKPVWQLIRRYECGVDAHDGKPVSIEEIYSAVKNFDNSGVQLDR